MSIQNVNGEEIETGVEEGESKLKTVDRFYWRAQFEHQLSHLTMADDKAEIAKYIAYLGAKFMPTVPDAALTDTWVLQTRKDVPPGFVEELIQKEQVRRKNVKNRPKWMNVTPLIKEEETSPATPSYKYGSKKWPFYGDPLTFVYTPPDETSRLDVAGYSITNVTKKLKKIFPKYNVHVYNVLAQNNPYVFVVETGFETQEDANLFNSSEELTQFRGNDISTAELR